jgi:hypothetical protein
MRWIPEIRTVDTSIAPVARELDVKQIQYKECGARTIVTLSALHPVVREHGSI